MNHDSQGQRRLALYTIWGTLRIMVLKVSWGTLWIMIHKVSWRVCMVRPRFRRAP